VLLFEAALALTLKINEKITIPSRWYIQ